MAQPEYYTVLKLTPQNKLIHYLNILNYIYLQLYVRRKGANVPCTHMDIRRQVLGVGPLFHYVVLRDQIQVVRLCNKLPLPAQLFY